MIDIVGGQYTGLPTGPAGFVACANSLYRQLLKPIIKLYIYGGFVVDHSCHYIQSGNHQVLSASVLGWTNGDPRRTLVTAQVRKTSILAELLSAQLQYCSLSSTSKSCTPKTLTSSKLVRCIYIVHMQLFQGKVGNLSPPFTVQKKMFQGEGHREIKMDSSSTTRHMYALRKKTHKKRTHFFCLEQSSLETREKGTQLKFITLLKRCK